MQPGGGLNKAFTLIELLAVIIIIGIIALIVSPIVINTIKKSEKSTFERSIDGLIESVRIDYSDDSFLAPRRYFYEQRNLTLLTVNDVTKDKPVRINGKINGNGFIYVDGEGIIHIENLCDKHYCANGEEGEVVITPNETGEIPSEGKDTPTITLNGESTIYVELGGEYIEEGAKARTIGGEELEYRAEIKLNDEVVESIDTSVENEYIITYSTTNKEKTVSVTRKVIVVEMKPVITMTEPDTNYVKMQEVLITVSAIKPNKVERFTVEIKKNGESISTEEVTGLSKTLSFTETGSYEVIVTATDNNNHTSTLSKTYRISNSVPVITVVPKEIILTVDKVVGYNLKTGVTARDDVDGDIESSEIEVIGSLSPTEGTYTITYKVTNSVGNEGTETRTIIVEAKGLPDPGEGGEIVRDEDGNPRYAGGNPNNYVVFGDDMYRIIGLFNGQMKIIYWGPKTAVGQFYQNIEIPFDPNASNGGHGSHGYNDWAQAKLQTTLNTEYWNTIPTNYQVMVDQSHVWNIGGTNTVNQTRSQYYSAERSTAKSSIMSSHLWTGKIGLMYPSDYGYATNGTSCDTDMEQWYSGGTGNASCYSTSNNWLANTSYYQWTMTPYTDNEYRVFSVFANGQVYNYNAYYSYRARPVVFLKEDIELVSGTGTESEPYILGDKTAAPILNYNSISSNDKWIKGTNITGYVTDVYDITKFSYEVIKNGTSLGETEVKITGREGQTTIPLQETGEYSIILRATNSNGINAELTSGTYKIDSIPPTVGEISGNNSSWTASKTLSATLQDSNSGVAYYMWTTSSSKPTETTSGWTSVGTATTNYSFSRAVSSNGTYYLWAKDGAGNVSTTGKNIAISYIDTTTPSLTVNNYSGTVGDNVSISSRYSASYGNAGGYTTCRYNGTTITNINYFTSAGTYTVSCTAYGYNGRNSGSKSMTVTLAKPGMTGSELATKENLSYLAGMYRFVGQPNNFVCFGLAGATSETCGDSANYVYRWRVIGIDANGRMKMIRSFPIDADGNGKAWDIKGTATDWASSSMKTYLNEEYWKKIPSEYQALVEQNATWNVGRLGAESTWQRATIYQYETQQKWTGTVGLINVSDYVYASSNSDCTDTARLTCSSWRDCPCGIDNFLHHGDSWMMNPGGSGAAMIGETANDRPGLRTTSVSVVRSNGYGFSVYPVIYLKSSVRITGGTGTAGNPYMLSL